MPDKKITPRRRKSHLFGYPEGFRAGRKRKLGKGKLECTVCGKDIKDFFFYYSYIKSSKYNKTLIVFTSYNNILNGQPGYKHISYSYGAKAPTAAEIACGKACAELICLRLDYYKGDNYKEQAYRYIFARD